MGIGYNPKIVTNGLVFCVDAGNTKSYTGTGTTVTDLATGSTPGATNFTYSSGAFVFSGSHYIQYASSTVFDTSTPTVEAWIKPTALSQNGFIFEKGTVNTQYSLFIGGSVVYFRHHTGGGLSDLVIASSYLSTTVWTHLVGTMSSTTKIIYVNGVSINSGAHPGTIQTNQGPQCIGQFGGANGYPYNGQIAVVRVYNRALPAAEVSQNFNALRGRFGI